MDILLIIHLCAFVAAFYFFALTIFGHEVRFLFADEFEVTPRFEENAELLELADVDEITTLVPFAECEQVSADQAAMFLAEADVTLVL